MQRMKRDEAEKVASTGEIRALGVGGGGAVDSSARGCKNTVQ
jgi:hypothetical protein